MAEREKILKRIKSIILEKEPDARIILYGSRARGNPHPESDWDILILLKKENIKPDIIESIHDSLYDYGLETGEVFSTMIYSEKEWNNKYRVTPFYMNIMEEGEAI